MTETKLLAAKLENANDISLHVWDPIRSWSEDVSLTGEEQSAVVADLRAIGALRNALAEIAAIDPDDPTAANRMQRIAYEAIGEVYETDEEGKS